MEQRVGGRIVLSPRPLARRAAALPAALLGHCPGRVRLERLLPLGSMLDEMRGAGDGARVDELLALSELLSRLRSQPAPAPVVAAAQVVATRRADAGAAGILLPARVDAELGEPVRAQLLAAGLGDYVDAASTLRLFLGDPANASLVPAAVNALASEVGALYHLPLPLRSSAEFHDVFPDAGDAECAYASALAGSRAWLARAVDDYFVNGGETAWVLRIPERSGAAGFLSLDDRAVHPATADRSALRGVAAALAVPSIAVLALPDLERLQIPANLAEPPAFRPQNPAPTFLPLSSPAEPTSSAPVTAPSPAAPEPLAAVLAAVLPLLEKHRPDVQLLLSLPLAHSSQTDFPALDPDALSAIAGVKQHPGGRALRHVQLLFPYLRAPGSALHSAVGAIAGLQAYVARRTGPWGSIAARPLVTDATPYPHVEQPDAVRLREDPGVGVLLRRRGLVSVDDERLVVPALHPDDYAGALEPRRFDGFRSAEVMRFLGFLRRQLRALGEVLLFEVDHRDARLRILLDRFFRQLHARGALRGALPEQAYALTERRAPDGVLAVDISIAPSFPIDRLRLTFADADGGWGLEVAGE